MRVDDQEEHRPRKARKTRIVKGGDEEERKDSKRR
jgi:hypothetical protein